VVRRLKCSRLRPPASFDRSDFNRHPGDQPLLQKTTRRRQGENLRSLLFDAAYSARRRQAEARRRSTCGRGYTRRGGGDAVAEAYVGAPAGGSELSRLAGGRGFRAGVLSSVQSLAAGPSRRTAAVRLASLHSAQRHKVADDAMLLLRLDCAHMPCPSPLSARSERSDPTTVQFTKRLK